MEICLKVKAAGPEIHYFDKHFEKGEDWYASRMPAVTQEQLATEKTPALTIATGLQGHVVFQVLTRRADVLCA